MPDFVPGISHGHPEFIADRRAVLMGRTTFDPALNAPSWPWAGLPVYVLTSRALPSGLPGVVASAPTAGTVLRGIARD
jgi:dihydrofolate reductase